MLDKITIPAVTVMKGGRITIDKAIRDAYGIESGTVWKITLERIEGKPLPEGAHERKEE